MIHKNVNEKQHNSRLDHAATSLYEDFSRSQIQRWISQGNLLVNGEILKAKDKVHTGDEISQIQSLKIGSRGMGKTYPSIFCTKKKIL